MEDAGFSLELRLREPRLLVRVSTTKSRRIFWKPHMGAFSRNCRAELLPLVPRRDLICGRVYITPVRETNYIDFCLLLMLARSVRNRVIQKEEQKLFGDLYIRKSAVPG